MAVLVLPLFFVDCAVYGKIHKTEKKTVNINNNNNNNNNLQYWKLEVEGMSPSLFHMAHISD